MKAGVFVPGGILTPGAGLVGSGARTVGAVAPDRVLSADRFAPAPEAEPAVEPFFTVGALVEVDGPALAPSGAVLSLAAGDVVPIIDDTAAVSCTAAVSDPCLEEPQPAAASAAAVIATVVATAIAPAGRRLTGCPA